MLRDIPVSELMATEVVSFTPDENVRDAMRDLLLRDVDAGPVVDGDGRVVGILSTGDLIVQGSALHLPAVIDILGATVGEVMATDVRTCQGADTLEDAATLMHDHDVSRLPVVDDDGRLVGIIARGDVVRAIVADIDRAGEGEPDEG